MKNKPIKTQFLSVLGLLFLAPFIGEYLLGNLPITFLWALPIQATLYGAGAILIRETTCRMNTVWPSRILLCLVYGIIEEVFVAQTLFNNNYLGLHLLSYGYINYMGIGAWWTIFVLSLHTIWSTAVPIVFIESFLPEKKNDRWLGLFGFILIAIVYAGGCIFLSFALNKGLLHGSSNQIIFSISIIFLLIAAALILGKYNFNTPTTRKIPSPFFIGCTAFALSTIFLYLSHMRSILSAEFNIFFMLLIIITGAIIFIKWSNSSNWKHSHTLATLTGLVFAYIWYGFIQPATMNNITPYIKYSGNIVFSITVIVLLIILWVRKRKYV